MTDTKRRIKMLLLERDMTIADLVTATGLSRSTIENAMSGRASKKSKRVITNALGSKIWDGIEVTEARIPWRAGTIVRWPSEAETAQFLNEVGSAGVEIRKGLVKIVSDIELLLTFDTTTPPLSPAEAKAIGGPEIEIWGPGDEAEALVDDEKRFGGAGGKRRTPHKEKRPSGQARPRPETAGLTNPHNH